MRHNSREKNWRQDFLSPKILFSRNSRSRSKWTKQTNFRDFHARLRSSTAETWVWLPPPKTTTTANAASTVETPKSSYRGRPRLPLSSKTSSIKGRLFYVTDRNIAWRSPCAELSSGGQPPACIVYASGSAVYILTCSISPWGIRL